MALTTHSGSAIVLPEVPVVHLVTGWSSYLPERPRYLKTRQWYMYDLHVEHHEVSELNFGGAKLSDSMKRPEIDKICHPKKLTLLYGI